MKLQMTRAAAVAAMVLAAVPAVVMAGAAEDVKSINDGWAHIV